MDGTHANSVFSGPGGNGGRHPTQNFTKLNFGGPDDHDVPLLELGSERSPAVAISGLQHEGENASGLFGGIKSDLCNRWACYRSDWTDGVGFGLLAPATSVFFASVIPALTFGEQIYDETDGEFGGTQVLLSTAICGVIQAVFGGQPMLIVGVAQPIIITYTFMYEFAEDAGIPYREWCACTCYWAGGIIMVLAAVNSCNYIHSFTRFSGELFGLLIAVLFFQQGAKGLMHEFQPDFEAEEHPDTHHAGGNLTTSTATTTVATIGEPGAIIADQAHYVRRLELLFNGAWAVFLATGLVVTTMLLRETNNTNYFKSSVRKFIAEYSTFLMVGLWTGISFAPQHLQGDIPRRIKIEATWSAQSEETWRTVETMHVLDTGHTFLALIPAIIIVVLFYFDHNVSAQLAQSSEFGLTKPHAYHWDFFLLGIMTLICGVCGILPVNGVIPQAPMHTKANAQFIRDTAVTGKKGTKKFVVREQRVTNLLQSLFCLACLFITEALKQIPRSVLWGFFIFMSLDSLPGSQFWERIQLFFTDSKRLKNLVRGDHNAYLDNLDYTTVRNFTLLQLLGFAICYAVSWVPKVGVIFPVLIMLTVPFRKSQMPKCFEANDLLYLDPLESDEVPIPTSAGPVAHSIADQALHVELDDTTALDDAFKQVGISTGGYLGYPRPPQRDFYRLSTFEYSEPRSSTLESGHGAGAATSSTQLPELTGAKQRGGVGRREGASHSAAVENADGDDGLLMYDDDPASRILPEVNLI